MSDSRLSERARSIQQSAAILVDQRVRELVREGKDIIGLGTGEPDFDTPENIKQAAIVAIRHGKTKYTTVDGIAELKQAVIDKFRRENAIEYKPSQISVCAGGKQAISNALGVTVDPGDEVVIPAPYWVTYPDVVKVWGGRPVFVECPQSAGFKITPAQLEQALTPKSKWLILNSPSNPTGAVYSSGELAALAEVLRRFPRVNIMSDDIYERIVFDGLEFSTLAQVAPDLSERILIVNGVSKTYCMTGWRLGYAAGPQDMIGAMAKLQGQLTTHPSSISQHAAVAALSGDQSVIETLTSTYQRRRDLVVSRLNQCAGLDCSVPEGAFYVYPSCAGTIGKVAPNGRTIKSDEDFTIALLECEGVAVTQGAAFGLSPHFRVSIAAADEKLMEACRRIGRFCMSLN